MYQIFEPPPNLKSIIRYYWLLEKDKHRHELMFAYPYVNLVFTLGLPYAIKDCRSNVLEVKDTRILGPRTNYAEYNHPKGNLTFGVTFQFGQVSTILGAHVNEITNETLQLSEILSSHSYLNDAFKDVSLNRFITLLNESHLCKEHVLKSSNQAIWLNFRHLIESGKAFSIPIKDIASKLKISQRHLQRICLDFAGLTPKTIQSMLRFRMAIREITNSGDLTLLHDYGYFDQSHFIKETHRWTGHSANKLLEKMTLY